MSKFENYFNFENRSDTIFCKFSKLFILKIMRILKCSDFTKCSDSKTVTILENFHIQICSNFQKPDRKPIYLDRKPTHWGKTKTGISTKRTDEFVCSLNLFTIKRYAQKVKNWFSPFAFASGCEGERCYSKRCKGSSAPILASRIIVSGHYIDTQFLGLFRLIFFLVDCCEF
jgi:hypothetical protein